MGLAVLTTLLLAAPIASFEDVLLLFCFSKCFIILVLFGMGTIWNLHLKHEFLVFKKAVQKILMMIINTWRNLFLLYLSQLQKYFQETSHLSLPKTFISMHISFKLYKCIYKADFLESGKKGNKLLFYGIEIYNFPQELKDKFQDKFCLFC